MGSKASGAAIDALVHLGRLVADAGEPAGVLAGLVDAAWDRPGTSAVAVVEVSSDETVRLVAERGLPPALAERLRRGDLGLDAVAATLHAAAGSEAFGHTIPLVCAGGLYGALILLHRGARGPAEEEEALAQAMADLAGVALDRAGREAELRRVVAELRASREALVRAEALKQLGQLAAIVAHEVRNPLGGAAAALQVLEAKPDMPAGHARVLGMVRDRLDGLQGMITDLLVYARPRPPIVRPVAFDTLVRKVATALREDPACAGVAVEVEAEEALGSADPEQLHAVLLNLGLNAAQALGGRGHVRLSARRDGAGYALAVADDGPGVPPEVRDRIFEPFFTTKVKGTGLGLAVARQVAEGHGGSIELTAGPAGGAVFTVRLPG